MTFTRATFDVGWSDSRHARSSWGSALVPFAGGSRVALTLSTNGFPSDLISIDVEHGERKVCRGLLGMLRDAVEIASDGTLWVLTAYRLYQIDITSWRILRTVNVPKHHHTLLPIRGGTQLVVSRRNGKRSQLVSLADARVVKQISAGSCDMALDMGDETALLSFWLGETTRWTTGLSRAVRQKLPVGLQPSWNGALIEILLGARAPFRNVSPSNASVTWVYPTGRLGVLSPALHLVGETDLPAGVIGLHGRDAGHRLVVNTAGSLLLVDTASRTVVAQHEFGADQLNGIRRLADSAQLGAANGVVYRVGPWDDAPLHILRWT